MILDHVAGGNRVAPETADGKASAIQCERRNDRVHARAIGQAGIDHGRRFIDAPAHAGDNALDDLHEVLVVFERQAGQFQFAGALNVNPVEAVDQNVGDCGIFEQGLERTEAENLVENFARKALAFGEAERNDFVVDRVADEDENFFAGRVAGGAAELFQIEAIEDLAVQVCLYLLVLGVLEGLEIRHEILYRMSIAVRLKPHPFKNFIPF